MTPPRVEPGLCLVGAAAVGLQDAGSVLQALAGRAVEAGYAGPGLLAALQEREAAYPTGLPLALPTATPHADAVHTRRTSPPAATPCSTDEAPHGPPGPSCRHLPARA